MKHAKELWRVDVEGAGHYILDADGHSVVVFGEPELPLKIITCVNACPGMGDMQPGSVKELARIANAILDQYTMGNIDPPMMDDLSAALHEVGERP